MVLWLIGGVVACVLTGLLGYAIRDMQMKMDLAEALRCGVIHFLGEPYHCTADRCDALFALAEKYGVEVRVPTDDGLGKIEPPIVLQMREGAARGRRRGRGP